MHAELTDDSRVVIQLASGSDDLVCRQAFWTALSLKLSQTMTQLQETRAHIWLNRHNENKVTVNTSQPAITSFFIINIPFLR